jgi:hypothetical protein
VLLKIIHNEFVSVLFDHGVKVRNAEKIEWEGEEENPECALSTVINGAYPFTM